MAKCPECGKEISNQGALNAHMITHKKPDSVSGTNWKGTGKNLGMEYLKGRASQSGNSGNSSGKKSHLGPLILILIIGGFIFGTIIVPGLESGFWQSTLAPIAPVFEALNKFASGAMRTISDALSGRGYEFVSTGGAEVSKKTGLSLRNIDSTATFVGEPVFVDGDLVTGKLDESVPVLKDVELSCELDGVKGNMGVRNQNYGEKAKFDIYSPGQRDEVVDRFNCVFDPDKIATGLTKAINTKEVIILLNYPLIVDSSLEVYVMPTNAYLNYRGREDDAFDEFLDGRSSNVLSTTQFISDVETSLSFDKQPLGVSSTLDSVSNLRIGLRNTDVDNKVKINGYKVSLSQGMKLKPEGCADFDSNFDTATNTYYATLKSSEFKDFEDALNTEGLGKKVFLCQVYIDEAALGGSSSPLVFAGKVTSKLDSRYTLKSKETVAINQKPTA